MMILTTTKNIVNIIKTEDFHTFLADYSKVSKAIYPSINNSNQYKIKLKYNGFFSQEFTIGEYETREQAREMERGLFEALRGNKESYEM